MTMASPRAAGNHRPAAPGAVFVTQVEAYDRLARRYRASHASERTEATRGPK